MPTTDPRIDAYIQKAAAFAQPILTELRRRIHAAIPDAEETIKWGAPFFLRDGRIIASTPAFKSHAKFMLWPDGMNRAVPPESVDFGSVEDLPKEKPFLQRLKAVAKAGPAKKTPAAAKKTAGGAKKKAASAKKAVPAARKKPAPKKKASTSKKPAAKKRATASK